MTGDERHVTVTHVMARGDAVRCFPHIDAARPGGILQRVDHQPSVGWLVVAESLACLTCDGVGSDGPNMHTPLGWDCPDCLGTGLPDVEIVSEPTVCVCGIPNGQGCYCDTTVHGVVGIGAAVPIVDHDSRPMRARVYALGTELLWVGVNDYDHPPDITDQFGSQAITPGMWAHPILTVTP